MEPIFFQSCLRSLWLKSCFRANEAMLVALPCNMRTNNLMPKVVHLNPVRAVNPILGHYGFYTSKWDWLKGVQLIKLIFLRSYESADFLRAWTARYILKMETQRQNVAMYITSKSCPTICQKLVWRQNELKICGWCMSAAHDRWCQLGRCFFCGKTAHICMGAETNEEDEVANRLNDNELEWVFKGMTTAKKATALNIYNKLWEAQRA